ncbi:MAG: ABC transporter ATP-binding protein [Chloroflexota bacterium]|nr:ABC transporter ATP-binding protein [Chloroflexota bacterium]
MAESTSIVALRGLGRNFGDVEAVRDVSLEVPRGAILGIIGPSGSGKTTLVRMLTGTLTPTAGQVSVLGQEPRKFTRKAREQIGYMPQAFVLYEELTAWENVDFVASLFGLLWPRRQRRVREVLELVDLWEVRGRRARQLSGGMQRRLELACALVHHPILLFVDEPTAGLDPVLRQSIWAEFRRLRDLGRTLVVTTQYVAEAEYCDEVAVLSHGRLLALAPPDELRRRAVGGEVVELHTATAFDGTVLQRVAGVRAVQQSSARLLRVVTDDAGEAIPRLLQEVNAAGVEVVSSSEYRPIFDEVFAALVEREEQAQEQRERDERDGRPVARAA